MKVNNISIIGNRKKVRNSTFYWVWRVILVFQPTSKKIHDRARHSTENNIKLFTLNSHRNEKMLSSYITNFLVFFFLNLQIRVNRGEWFGKSANFRELAYCFGLPAHDPDYAHLQKICPNSSFVFLHYSTYSKYSRFKENHFLLIEALTQC